MNLEYSIDLPSLGAYLGRYPLGLPRAYLGWYSCSVGLYPSSSIDRVGELRVKDVLTVAGRVDLVVFLEGSTSEIIGEIKKMFEVEGVETTETLWEVES